MSIRKKTLLVIFITVVALFVAVYFIASISILQGFATVENNDTQQQTKRVLDAIQNKIATLGDVANAWAVWDDTYKFVVDHNKAYIKSDVNYEVAIKPTSLNMIFWIDNKPEIVAKLVMDYATGKEITLPASLLPYFTKGSRLVTHPDKDDYIAGIIGIENKPLLIQSRAVVTSEDAGPVHGSVVQARYIDDAFIKDISATTHENVTIFPYQSTQLPQDFLQAKQHLLKTTDIYIDPLSSTQIAGYGIAPDLVGKPGAIVKILLSRTIYQQGQQTVSLFTALFAIIAVVLAFSMIILLESTVVNRIVKLYKSVLEIGKKKDITARVFVSGTDEIGSLGEAINTMLDSISEAVAGKRESQARFKNIADNAPILIWMAGIDKQCTYVNKLWVSFTGRSLEEELGSGWQEAIHPDDKAAFLVGYSSVFEKQLVYEKEIRLKKSNGQYQWIAIRIVPNVTKDQMLIGCLGVGTDITNLKESTGQVERINQLLAGRESALTELKKENESLKNKN